MVDGVRSFTEIRYQTKYGENCVATKKDGIVTIEGDKYGIRQMPEQDFLKAFIQDQAGRTKLQRTPQRDEVSLEENSIVTNSKRKSHLGKIVGFAVGLGAILTLPKRLGLSSFSGLLKHVSKLSGLTLPQTKGAVAIGAGILGVAGVGIGAVVDKAINKYRAKKADKTLAEEVPNNRYQQTTGNADNTFTEQTPKTKFQQALTECRKDLDYINKTLLNLDGDFMFQPRKFENTFAKDNNDKKIQQAIAKCDQEIKDIYSMMDLDDDITQDQLEAKLINLIKLRNKLSNKDEVESDQEVKYVTLNNAIMKNEHKINQLLMTSPSNENEKRDIDIHITKLKNLINDLELERDKIKLK